MFRVKKKLEWWGYQKLKIVEDIFSLIHRIHERVRHPDGHRNIA